MNALLPCPFCGGIAELADIGNWHTKSRATEVKCTGCLVKKRFAAIRQGHEKTREWAVTWWNRRAPSSEAQPISPSEASAGNAGLDKQ